MVPRVEAFGEAADLKIVCAATGGHPFAEALGDEASAEMQDSLGSGHISTLENPVGVADDIRKKPRTGEGVSNQRPAEAL